MSGTVILNLRIPSSADTLSYQFNKSITIREMKQTLLDETKTDEAGNVVPMFPVIQQRGAKSAEDLSLIFGGKFLADGDRLNDTPLAAEQPTGSPLTLHLMIRPKDSSPAKRAGVPPAQTKGCCLVM